MISASFRVVDNNKGSGKRKRPPRIRTAFSAITTYESATTSSPQLSCGGDGSDDASVADGAPAASPWIHPQAKSPGRLSRSSLQPEPGSSQPRSHQSCQSEPICGWHRCPSQLPGSSSCSPLAELHALCPALQRDDDDATQSPAQSCRQPPASHPESAASSMPHRPGSPSRHCLHESDGACRG